MDGVYRDFLTDHAALLREPSLAELRSLAAAGHFPVGSMGPKVGAADEFLSNGGSEVRMY